MTKSSSKKESGESVPLVIKLDKVSHDMSHELYT